MLPARGIVINGANGAVNQTSSVINADHMVQISIQAAATGTITGTLKVQVSNDTDPDAIANWSDLTGATIPIAGPAPALIPALDISYAFLRFVYTATAGAGTITVRFKSNGF